MPEWKDTINLPRTDFPMKANLPTSEPETLARWAAMDLYGKIRASRKGAPKFVLHDQRSIHVHATQVAPAFRYSEPGTVVMLQVLEFDSLVAGLRGSITARESTLKLYR